MISPSHALDVFAVSLKMNKAGLLRRQLYIVNSHRTKPGFTIIKLIKSEKTGGDKTGVG